MEFINPYSIPAIVALVLKLGLLWVVRVMPLRDHESRVFLAFLFVLTLHNFSEIMVFNHGGATHGIVSLRPGVLYFSMSIVAMAVLVHLMLIRLRVSTAWRVPVARWRWIYLPAALVLVMLWTSDDMIRGFERYGFSYTRVPGPLYGWFELYALTYLLGAILLLMLATRFSINRSQRRKNTLALTGLAPIIILPIAVIVLQMLELNYFNLPMWFALAFTFFLMVMAYAIYEHRLFDVFFYLPGTRLHSRRTRFHQSIKDFLAELDRLPVVNLEQALSKLAEAMKCSVALVGPGRETLQVDPASRGVNHLDVGRLDRSQLDRIGNIVLTKEVRGQDPDIYQTLHEANCAAVVPFRPFKSASAGWLLLGGKRSAPDELPIDFAVVESLFGQLGDLFLEDIVREREHLQTLQCELAQQQEANRELETELSRRQQKIDLLYSHYTQAGAEAAPRVTLEELTGDLERRVIARTLNELKGNVSATAKALGLTRQTLYARMETYGIENNRRRQGRAHKRG